MTDPTKASEMSSSLDPATMAHEGVEAVTDTFQTAAATAEATGKATAEMAETVTDTMSSAASTVASETSKAFEAARQRLQTPGLADFSSAQGFAGRFREDSDALSRKMTGGYEHATQVMAEFNAKAVEAWRKNAEATIAHWQKLASVTSWSEAIALNTAHVRQQIEVMTSQTRDLADLASRMARESTDRLTSKL